MDAKQYQEQVVRTLIDNLGEFTHQELMTIWGVIGLTGEAGEVAEMVKKGIFHRHGLEREKLIKELGDVAWYLASICTVQNIDLGEVMQANIEKLRLRYPDGFSTADSVKRVDVDLYFCPCGVTNPYTEKECINCHAAIPAPGYVSTPALVEMCKCGHSRNSHMGDPEVCLRFDEKDWCPCILYTPIPALLRADQPPLFDTDK